MEKMICESKKMIMDWGRLPTCIGTTIFSKLVISNLPICRLVCRTWNHIVLDYASATQFQCLTTALLICTNDEAISFLDDSSKVNCNATMQCMDFDSRKHLHANFDLDSELMKSPSLLFDGNWSIHIISQCNGLLYVITNNYEYHGLYNHGIFNPMTNEFIQIPWHDEYGYDVIGFGCGISTKQYKLFRVRTTFPRGGEGRKGMEMDVLRFGNDNKWRYLPFLPSPSHVFVCSAYLNGVIYWLGKVEAKENEVVIHAFDVETEKFESSTILDVGLVDQESLNLYKFKETIYATFIEMTYDSIQVWKMQEKGSWIPEVLVMDDIPNHWRDLTIIEALEDRETILCMVNFRFFCFYNSIFGRRRKKVIPRYREKTRFRSIWKIESLNFGSLSNILSGECQ